MIIGISKSATNYHVACIDRQEKTLVFEPNLSLDVVQELLSYTDSTVSIYFYSVSRNSYLQFHQLFPERGIKHCTDAPKASIIDEVANVKHEISEGILTADSATIRLIDETIESSSMVLDMVSKDSELYSDKLLQALAIYLAYANRESESLGFYNIGDRETAKRDEWGRNAY